MTRMEDLKRLIGITSIRLIMITELKDRVGQTIIHSRFEQEIHRPWSPIDYKPKARVGERLSISG